MLISEFDKKISKQMLSEDSWHDGSNSWSSQRNNWTEGSNDPVPALTGVDETHDDEKIAGIYDPEDFDAMVARVGKKAKEQQMHKDQFAKSREEAIEFIKKQGYGRLLDRMSVKEILQLIKDERSDYGNDHDDLEENKDSWAKHNNPRAGGMSKKSVRSYRRSHPGSKIQTAVTTKPSKLKKGSKASKRRKSFCARMRGMKKHRTSAKTAHNPNSNINKSLRRWHCESIEEMQQMLENAQRWFEEKQRLDPHCWSGYKKQGTKMKGGVRVNNCVPKEDANDFRSKADSAFADLDAARSGTAPGLDKDLDNFSQRARAGQTGPSTPVKSLPLPDQYENGKRFGTIPPDTSYGDWLKSRGMPTNEENRGLYYNVNKRKKAGTSRPKGHPLAPTDQAWKDAAKTANTNEGTRERMSRYHDQLRQKSGLPDPTYYEKLKAIYQAKLPDNEHQQRVRELKAEYKINTESSNDFMPADSTSPVGGNVHESAYVVITNRIIGMHPLLINNYGMDAVLEAARQVADSYNDELCENVSKLIRDVYSVLKS